MITKLFKKFAQGIVNLYDGQYGEVKKIFPSVETFHFVAKAFFKYDTEGFYYIDPITNFGYLFIKGTDKPADWISNFVLCGRKIPYPGVNPKLRVHTGFSEGYILIQEWFLDTFKNCETLYIIGHSRGCPIACLAALDVQFNGYLKSENIFVMIEGCPRWANKLLMESYERRIPNTFAFRKGLDIVCFIPPIIYSYFSKIYKIGKAAWPFPNSRDHYPMEYLKAMQDFKL